MFPPLSVAILDDALHGLRARLRSWIPALDRRTATVYVGPQIVSGDARHTLDGEHALGWHPTLKPLADAGMRNTQLAGKPRDRTPLGQHLTQSFGHAANDRYTFLRMQAYLLPRTIGRKQTRIVADDQQTFGDRLRAARKRKHKTQAQVGEYCGLEHMAVNHWENGRNLPSLENMIVVAELYETTIDALVWGDMGTGIEARLRRIPKVLRDGLVDRLHREIDETEKLAARLPKEMASEPVKDTDARLASWSAKNKPLVKRATKSKVRRGTQ